MHVEDNFEVFHKYIPGFCHHGVRLSCEVYSKIMSLIKFRGIQCNCDRVILALIFLSEVIE